MLDWPSLSPDLSPIENVWSCLDRRVEAMGPTTLEELKTCTFRAWKELSKEGLGSKLLKTMPKRLEE
eukprot:scaffold3016_cov12698-Pavlova_lutheri.AAC.1